MLDPRSSSRTGLSSQGTLLLALIGASAALFLFWVMPSMTSTTRAAAPRQLANADSAEDERAPQPETESLMAPPAVLASPDSAEAGARPNASAVGAAAESAATVEKAKDEGPKLQHIKGHGKSGQIEPGALRAEQREKRKERLAKESAEAAAFGTEDSAAIQAKAEPPVENPKRERVVKKGGKPGNQVGLGPPKDPAQRAKNQQAKKKPKKDK